MPLRMLPRGQAAAVVVSCVGHSEPASDLDGLDLDLDGLDGFNDRRGAGTPRAPKAQHEAADRRERVTVDSAYVDGTACPAAGTVHVEPRHAG